MTLFASFVSSITICGHPDGIHVSNGITYCGNESVTTPGFAPRHLWPCFAMGGDNSKPTPPPAVIKDSDVTNASDASSGFHMIEIHSRTAGIGFMTVLVAAGIAAGIYYCYRASRRRAARRAAAAAAFQMQPMGLHNPAAVAHLQGQQALPRYVDDAWLPPLPPRPVHPFHHAALALPSPSALPPYTPSAPPIQPPLAQPRQAAPPPPMAV